MDSRVVKDLEALKQRLESAKQEKSRIQGQRQVLMAELKEKYGVSTIQDAQKLLKQKEADLEDAAAQIGKLFEDVKAVLHG